MHADRFEVVQALFAAALEHPPEKRAAFLATVDDPEVSAEVVSLLEAHESGGRLDSLMERLRGLQVDLPSVPVSELLHRLRDALGTRYRVERELGQGGMAIVFLAMDVRHGRRVALKILPPELAHELGTGRFLQEIAIAARLAHPNILPLHDSGDADGLLYYVMPYVEHESLRRRLDREGALPVEEALKITREVADALGYAHRHGVVHRDIKPDNILLEAGHAVVSDFGIARAMKAAGDADLSEAVIALGTPAYMSPEQVRGDPRLDGRSDLYSLACVLHEMLGGTTPFSGRGVDDVLNQHLREPPPLLPAVPPWLTAVTRRAMAKAPADRYATAEAFAEALVAPRPEAAQWRRVGVVAAPVVLAAGLAVWVLADRASSPLPESASVVAVLPPSPRAPDTTLARLGRDLVVTISANLDGVSGIRTVDALTILAQTSSSGMLAGDAGARLARQLGASSAVHSTIARNGSTLSIDARLVAIEGGQVLARASWSGDSADLAALTDSVTWALLRGVWRTRTPPTPNLAAVTTRSMPALRSFLQGEREGLDSRWDAAAESYERAMRADSTFWLAYWRFAFARWWYLEAVDNNIITAIRRHRYALPERDRLVFDSWVTDTFSVALAHSGDVTRRFPEYWPGWMQHGDWLFHVGPVYGHDRAESKAALERTVALNPSLLPAWEHLYWAAMPDDTVTAARAIEALTRLGFSRTSSAEFGHDIGRVYRFELALRQSGAVDERLRDSIVVDLVTTGRGRLGGGAIYPPAQVALSERVLRTRPRPPLAMLHELLLSDTWASRGAWDTALLFAEQYSSRPSGADVLHAYRLAVVGTWLGAVNPERAMRLHAHAARAAGRPGATAMTRAEVAWLDGLFALARGDRDGVVTARERLRRADTVSTELLDRTLGAFEAGLSGERGLAARTLANTNWRNPDLLVPGYGAHPYVIAVSRFAAARWLAAEGALAEADRLLMWFEAPFALDGYRPARRVLGALAMLERARIAARQDRTADAQRAYAEFLRRYDAAAGAHEALLDEARNVSVGREVRRGG